MYALLSALFLAAYQPPANPRQTAWVFATVGQSEWCPAGNVMLDLRTGRYDFTARASRDICNDPKLERPVTHGALSVEKLASVRLAYQRVLSEGLESQACRDHKRPDYIVIDNGGVRVLVVTSGYASSPAPDDLTCWSDAATALKDLLDRTFSPGDYR